MSDVNDGVVIPGESGSHDASPERVAQAQAEKAKEAGWRPLEEFKGNPADWVDAKEFLGRQSLFDKIASLKGEIRNREQAFQSELKVIKEYVQTLSKTEYEKALRDLKAQRKTAIADADVDTVEQLDKDIDQIQTARKATEAVSAQPQAQKNAEIAEKFTSWKSKNDWYDTDSELRKEADIIGVGYGLKNPNASIDELTQYVESKVKKMYPEKFGKERAVTEEKKSGAAAVEAGGMSQTAATRSKEKGLSEADLTADQAKIMRTLVKSGVVTKEQYFAQLNDATQGVHAEFKTYQKKESK